MIRTLEELSMNAWPAKHSLHYDGWVLRTTDGYTKRANSVHPLYEPKLDLDEKIGFCESFYRNQGQPTVFKITASSTPPSLDTRLEMLGYNKESLTSVQILDLSAGNHEITAGIELTSTDSEAWHTAFARMNNVSVERRALHEHILRAILPDKCYASIYENGSIIGCGLGVLQSGYLGIFDIVIDAEHRNQGHGERLMRALLNWAIQHGTLMAYLQVMCDNELALHLYEKLGFKEKYQYWYRVKE